MKKRSLLAFASLAFAAACSDITTPSEMSIEDSYIVTVVDGVNPEVVAHDHGIVTHYVYTDALHGFAAWMSDATHAELLKDVRVKMIEADQIEIEQTTQTNATWGIDRLDQSALPLSTTYTYTSTGSGVTVYIIDTGILLGHSDFGGRAVKGYDVTEGGNASDCNGHGTHVASTVGGTTYGIAKAAKLVAVRVLNCSGYGTASGVIAGVDWVTRNHAARAIATMSLGSGASTSVDNAVAASIASGVTYVLAAGNSKVDACASSPARLAAAITVGATDNTDTKAIFSNFGSCLDIFAPGVSITAAWHTSTTATSTISGTSMATPHVAGVAALYLATNPGATPQQVRDALVAGATKSRVLSAGTGSPNALLFSNY